MELPHSKERQEYIDEIKVIEANLKDTADGKAPQELFDYTQKKLDELAKRFQESNEIGRAKYKLYELQALLYYFQNKDDEALDFIHEAIKTKGGSYKRAEQLIEKIEDSENPSHKKGILFFHKSPITVALLSFFTFNTYSIYWFYKHWRAIRLSTDERTYPILSSIFQLFTTYPLFKRIKNNATEHKYKKFRKPGLFSVGYIILYFSLNSIWGAHPANTDEAAIAIIVGCILSACIAAILFVVQKSANAHNTAALGKKYKHQKIFAGEIVFTILGLILSLLIVVSMFSNIPSTAASDSMSSEEYAAYTKMDQLRSQYDECNSNLEARRSSVNQYNDYAVNSFNNDLEDCEEVRVQLNSAVEDYNRIAGLK